MFLNILRNVEKTFLEGNLVMSRRPEVRDKYSTNVFRDIISLSKYQNTILLSRFRV